MDTLNRMPQENAIGTEATPVLVEEYGGEVANKRMAAQDRP